MKPSDVLQQRGFEAAAREAGWVAAPNPYDKRTPGWTFPIFEPSGEVFEAVIRWKNANSGGHPKYIWFPSGVDNAPKLYMLPGLAEAIRAAGGELHMVSGEPDVLTMVSAGIHNVTCAFGEKNLGKWLDTLHMLQPTKLVYWRDLDATGESAAQKVCDALDGTGITFECRRLEADGAEKYDLNCAWVKAGFDVPVFRTALIHSPIEDLQPSPKPTIDKRPAPPAIANPDYEEWCLEVEAVAIRTWHLNPPDKSGWSQMILCPFHPEDTGSAHYDYEGHGLYCHGACGCYHNTQEIADALDLESWQSVKDRKRKLRTSAKRDGNQPRKRVLRSRPEAAREAWQRLEGSIIPDVEPYLSPYKPLRQFGGLAKLWEPGQVGLIIAGAGMGKTSFLERCIDNLNKLGKDAIMWGPEWSDVRYQNRAVARYGGPKLVDQLEHESYNFETYHDVEDVEPTPLTKTELDRAKAILADIETWPGQTHYVDREEPLRRALKLAGEELEELRLAGRHFVVAAFDYAQLTLGSKAEWLQLEMMIAAVQNWSIKHNVFALVTSQVNKGEAERLRKKGIHFAADSAQLLSDQRVKLVLTLNPVYIDEERYEKAWITCVKNNIGVFPSRILVETALYRNDWTDHVIEGLTHGSVPGGEEPPPLEFSDDFEPPESYELKWYQK